MLGNSFDPRLDIIKTYLVHLAAAKKFCAFDGSSEN